MAKFVRLKDVKHNDYFVIPTAEEKPFSLVFDEFHFDVSASRVLVRGNYDRSSKKYSYHHFLYVCRESFKKGDTIVIIDFVF